MTNKDMHYLKSVINDAILRVDSISINTVDSEFTIVMGVHDKQNGNILITFGGVSSINIMYPLSPPMIIQGFEIIDNKQSGWENDKKFFVNDYEDGFLSFYCKNVEYTILES